MSRHDPDYDGDGIPNHHIVGKPSPEIPFAVILLLFAIVGAILMSCSK